MQTGLFSGCPSLGYYGENCSIPCPVNCLDGICDSVNGTCFGCLDGYSGPTCNEGYWFFHWKKNWNNVEKLSDISNIKKATTKNAQHL